MESSFSLRPATLDDLESMVRIEQQAYRAPARPWTRQHFEAELGKPYARLWVLTDDETDEVVAGYVAFWILDGAAELLNVAVSPEHQRRGFGTLLVRAVVKEAVRKGLERIRLEVRVSNQPALALYQSLRFAIVQVRKGFYADPQSSEDAYSMELLLDAPESLQRELLLFDDDASDV